MYYDPLTNALVGGAWPTERFPSHFDRLDEQQLAKIRRSAEEWRKRVSQDWLNRMLDQEIGLQDVIKRVT